MKKKLLVLASTFPRWEGDTEPRFVLDLVSHMVDTFDITVLVPAALGAKEKETLEGVNIIRYHYFPIHKWETLCYPGAIVPRIREKKVRVLLVPFLMFSLWFHLLIMLPKFDIVHAHWLIPQGIIQSFFKKPYIVTGHGGDVTSLNKGIIKLLKKRCLKKAKNVTVVSEHLKQLVVELEPSVCPHIISMGVDTSKFGKQYFISNYFNQGSKKVILFVGRLVEKKGVTYLIEAMKEVDAILVIVGDGPLRNQLEEQAEELGNRVQFLGAKTHSELQVIFASADILVIPSVTARDGDQEGLGLVILEAMASGLPVIASDSGGISQVVRNEYNGILFEEKNVVQLRNSIKRLINDQQLYRKIVLQSKETLIYYDYRYIADKYVKILNK